MLIDSGNVSLQVILDGRQVFSSDGKWLFPLFELEDIIKEKQLNIAGAEIVDKVVGKAGALLLTRLNVCSVHAGVMSQKAITIFDTNLIKYSYNLLVESIDCKTEEILNDVYDPEIAYHLIRKMAGLLMKE